MADLVGPEVSPRWTAPEAGGNIGRGRALKGFAVDDAATGSTLAFVLLSAVVGITDAECRFVLVCL